MNEMIYNTSTVSAPVEQAPVYEPYEITGQVVGYLWGAPAFDFSNPTLEPEVIASRLIVTAQKYNLYGIAATQCGLNYNVFVAGSGDEYVAFFNPKIIFSSDDLVILPEVDISTGLSAKIKRPRTIHLEYQDYTGETHVKQFDGFTSRIIQHNVDRLDGIKFEYSVSELKLERARKAQNKKYKKLVRSVMRNVRVK